MRGNVPCAPRARPRGSPSRLAVSTARCTGPRPALRWARRCPPHPVNVRVREAAGAGGASPCACTLSRGRPMAWYVCPALAPCWLPHSTLYVDMSLLCPSIPPRIPCDTELTLWPRPQWPRPQWAPGSENRSGVLLSPPVGVCWFSRDLTVTVHLGEGDQRRRATCSTSGVHTHRDRHC